ncbi:MAG: hypothetical protein M0Z76_04115 [Gammaproteobacteria bacterium]|nr:hypothetical protein [Gammaproteobacteria bacterium]
MEPFLKILRDRAHAGTIPADAALTEALGRLSRLLAHLAADLQVEYVGPHVGLGDGRDAFCLAVRAHEEAPNRRVWGVRVCSAQPHAGLRADWDLAAVSRLRKVIVVRALPAFLAGYAEAVAQAGRAPTRAGARLNHIAHALRADVAA